MVEMVYKELVVLKVVQVVVEQQLRVQLNLVLLEDLVQEDFLVEQEVQEHPMILQDQLSQLLEVVVELLVDIMVDLLDLVELVEVELVEIEVQLLQEQREQLTLVVVEVEVLMEEQQVLEDQGKLL